MADILLAVNRGLYKKFPQFTLDRHFIMKFNEINEIKNRSKYHLNFDEDSFCFICNPPQVDY